MDIKTFRAPTLQDALRLVRSELGPQAAVLHTREVKPARFWPFRAGRPAFEVTASRDVHVPSRVGLPAASAAVEASPAMSTPPAPVRDELHGQIGHLQSLVEDLCRRSANQKRPAELPEPLFQLYADLIENEIEESQARELVERARGWTDAGNPLDVAQSKVRLAQSIESEIAVRGPIVLTPGRRHVVALVGPTGVGKTTTIAKLAANFRLREKRRVGLITVDTYRIAAVEQLRTYADIMDLPMEVVSTPREMREAVRRLSDLDLVLLDTAGRSPRDEVKIQELRAFVGEAQADEVHLVLGAGASAATLRSTAERFSVTGTTALILTKLDEAPSWGPLLTLLRGGKLPLSYVTAGQNVPDDIEPAVAARLARAALSIERRS